MRNRGYGEDNIRLLNKYDIVYTNGAKVENVEEVIKSLKSVIVMGKLGFLNRGQPKIYKRQANM